MTIPAFVENPAGSHENHKYDEATGAYLGSTTLTGPYPAAYGFIPNTRAEDGDCIDCFVITDSPLRGGEIYPCTIIALMELWENGEADHKIILAPESETPVFETATFETLKHFEEGVFGGKPGKTVSVGELRGEREAHNFIAAQRVE